MNNDDDIVISTLLSGEPRIPHGKEFFTDSCIGMFHAAVAVRNTKYEGINPKHAFNYFQQLLNLPTHPLDLGLTPEQLQSAQDALEDLIYFNNLISSFTTVMSNDSAVQDPTAEIYTKKIKTQDGEINIKIQIKLDFNKVLAGLQERCQIHQRNYCYFPAGWAGNKEGHFAGLKLSKISNECYQAYYIDHGAGNNNHLPLMKSGNRIKRNSKSAPKLIDLRTEVGVHYLESIIRLRIDRRPFDTDKFEVKKITKYNGQLKSITLPENNTTINHYSETDAYGLLEACGKNLPSQIKLRNRPVTAQRAGTCTVTNTVSVTSDAIYNDDNVTLEKLKKYEFALKLSSLVEAYKAYCQGKTKFEIMQWTLLEFNVRIEKQCPELLNPNQLAFCAKIATTINARLKKDYQNVIENRCVTVPLPPLVGKIHSKKDAPLFDVADTSDQNEKITAEIINDVLDVSGCKPIYVLDYLLQACLFKEKRNDLNGFVRILEFMRSLHETTGQREDEYWDKVSEQDLIKIIECLTKLVSYRLENSAAVVQAYQLEMALVAYDIAAQIIHRIPEFKLLNHFALALDDVYSDKCYFFDPVSYLTVKQIAVNFQTRCKNKKIILSNSVNDNFNDATNEFILKSLLTDEKKVLAINMLKDLKALKSTATSIEDDELLVILLTKSCRIVGDDGKRKNVEFKTENILGQLFCDVLILSATAHSAGIKTIAYKSLQHDSSRNGQSMLYFSEQSYHQELALIRSMKTKWQSSIGLEKHFPKLTNDEAFQDFGENTIYHPQEDLIQKRQKRHQNDLRAVQDNETKKNELIPYEIENSGTLHTGKIWKNFDYNDKNADEIDEDLRSIEASPGLQFSRALEWAQYNIETLIHVDVQNRLFELFFQYDRIDSAFAVSFDDTVTLIKHFLVTGLSFYQDREDSEENYRKRYQNIEALLWLCRVQLHLLEYVKVMAKIFKYDLSQCVLPDPKLMLIEKLNNDKKPEIKSHIAIALMNSYRDHLQLTTNECFQLLKYRIISNLEFREFHNSKEIDEAEVTYEKVWAKHQVAIMHAVKSCSTQQLNQIINELMSICVNVKQECEWQLIEDELFTQVSDIRINLKKGMLSRNKIKQSDITDKFKGQNIFYKLGWKEKDRKFTLLNYGKNVVATPDGTYEFHYNPGNLDILSVYRNILIEGRTIRFKLIFESNDNHNVVNEYFAIHQLNNPFKKVYLDTASCFWKSVDQEQILFVEHYTIPNIAYLYNKIHGWVQLSQTKLGYVRNGVVLLDFTHGESELEKQWTHKLAKMIGLDGVIAEAKLLDNQQCQIQSIILKHLKLTFIQSENRLNSVDFPGFYLSGKQSIPLLHGLSSVIILINEFDEEKYIVPAFRENLFQGNAVFEREDIIRIGDVGTFSENRYYIYEVDRNNNLVGDTLEADLYLTALYGYLGDYRRAMQSLNRTEHHANSDRLLTWITECFSNRQDQSPLGVALACKVVCRMFRHMFKWCKKPDEYWSTNSYREPDLIIYILRELEFYQESLSSYKEKINIIPDYLRLDDADFVAINKLKNLAIERKNSYSRVQSTAKTLRPLVVEGVMHNSLHNDRLAEMFRLTYCDKLWDFDASLKGYVDYIGLDDARHRRQTTSYQLKLRYYYDKSDTALNAQKDEFGIHVSSTPGADYLKCFFIHLFEDAISIDQNKIKKLRATLYQLIQSDMACSEIQKLVPSLIFVMNHPDYFRDLPRFTTTKECFVALANRCFICITEYKIPNQCHLFDFSNSIVKLENQASLPNPLLMHEKLHFSLAKINIDSKYRYHLIEFYNPYFKATPKPVASGPFLLDSPGMKDPSLLEKHILDQYRYGHEQNQKKTKLIYHLNSDECLLKLKNDLLIFTGKITAGQLDTDENAERKIINIKEELNKKAAALVKLVNYTPLENNDTDPAHKTLSYLLIAAREGAQLSELTISDLISCLLTQDVELLTSKNPFLTQAHITALLENLTEYFLMQSQYDQATEALRLIADHNSIASLGKYNEQLLGTILNGARTYDIKEFPEFLVFEYAKKLLIRPDQVKALTDLIRLIIAGLATPNEIKHALLHFPAAGGKTSVLIILLSYIFARLGIMPFIFNTNEMYNIGVNDIPDNLKSSLKQTMEVIERDLEYVWTEQEFTQLLNDLGEWHVQKKCVLLKPITWHSIHVTKKIAKGESIGNSDEAKANEKLAASAQRILDYPKKNKCIKLEDENQIISDPLQETIKTYGPMQAIPLEQQQLMVKFYDYLLGVEYGCSDIASRAGITEKSKNIVSEQTLLWLQHEITQKIIYEKFFLFVNKTDLQNYLLQESRKRPTWLIQLIKSNKSLADLVILARSFIKTHLPHILSLQYAKNYGKSIHESDLTVAPKHDGKDVTSHYSDLVLVIALTIQFYAQDGEPADYVIKVIEDLEKDHIRERKWNKSITDAEIFLNSILPQNYPFVNLDGLSKAIKKTLSTDDTIRYHSAMLKEFLYKYVFKQIRTPKYRATSTPADFQAGFQYSIMFSATPGLRETLPVFLAKENCFYDHAFEAEVIDTLLHDKNAEYALIDLVQTPKEFFNELRTKSPEVFAAMTTLIDRGALLSNAKAEEVINAFLDDVTVQDKILAAACFEGEHLLLKSKNQQVGEIKILGTKLNEALKRKGLKPEQLLLFLFLALCNTTGTDVKRPHNDRAGLTIGKEQTVTETIQAAMRERLLLWEDAQRIMWLMFRSLYQEIYPHEVNFNRVLLFYWMIRNQALQDHSKIVMRTYQGIYQLIVSLLWSSIDNGDLNYEDYHEELRISCELDIAKMYEIESVIKSSELVLADYVSDLYHKFGIIKENMPEQTVQWINQIITETARLIKDMRQPHGAELNAQVCQEQIAESEKEQEMQEEQKVKSIIDRHISFKFNLEKYDVNADALDKIFDGLNVYQSSYSVIRLHTFGNIAVPKLYIRATDFAPLQQEGYIMSGEIKGLKPINILLVQIKFNDRYEKYRFIACTGTGSEFYRYQIIKKRFNQENSAYVFIGMDGHILFSSTNLSSENKSQLLRSPELQEMVNYAEFLNGRIKNPEELAKIVKKYRWTKNDYNSLVSAIGRVHVSRHAIRLTNVSKLERLCGWETEKPRYEIDKFVKAQKQMPQIPVVKIPMTEKLSARVCRIERDIPIRRVLANCIFGIPPQPRPLDCGKIVEKFPSLNEDGFVPQNTLMNK